MKKVTRRVRCSMMDCVHTGLPGEMNHSGGRYYCDDHDPNFEMAAPESTA